MSSRRVTAPLLLLLLWLLDFGARRAEAQPPTRLPPVYRVEPAQYATTLPGSKEPVVVLDQPEAAPAGPPGARKGVFQKLLFSTTWAPAPSRDDFGFTDVELSTVLGFPFPTVKSPLVVTPAFAVHYLDGPTGRPLPPRLYSTGVEFRWIRPITERLMADLAVVPGFYGDFVVDSGDAIRIPGRALGVYKWSEQTTLVLGVLYLDRRDVNLLPAGGILWKPSDDWNLELIFPRPKIARRFYRDGTERGLEYWGYVAGEFGGGQWAIETPGGQTETVILRDYRLLLGVESKLARGIGTRFEIGYIFGRTINFIGPTQDFSPNSTVLLRAGASY
jgi:hypothetical protein